MSHPSFWRVLVSALLCVISLSSCKFIGPVAELDVNTRFLTQPPIQEKAPTLTNPSRFSFLFFADIQVDNRLKESLRVPVLAFLKDYLTKEPVDFLISGGDNTENGAQAEYAYVHDQVTSLGPPVYWCLGNHDLFGEGWTHWQSRYGTATRVLKVSNLSLYILDNAGGTVGLEQRLWLEKQLKEDTATHKVVVMHFPLYSGNHYELDGQPHYREAYTLSKMFETYKVSHVLAGHTHIFRKVEVNNIPYTVVSALKENSQNKVFARIDIEGDKLTTTFVPVNLEGYIE